MTRVAATADAAGPAGTSVRRLPERAVAPLRGLAGLAGLVAVIEVLPHTGLVSAD